MLSKKIVFFALVLVCSAGHGEGPGISNEANCTSTVAGGFSFSRRDQSADKKQLYFLGSHGEQKTSFYEALGSIHNFAVSPRCDYVACSEYVSGTGQLLLTLLTIKGESVLQIPSSYRFSWAPDGGSIAYILGVDIEGGLGFRPSSIWTYSLDDSVARKLPCLGYDLSWAEHDGNLYIWDLGFETAVNVYQYDPRTEETEKTSHRGIFFSPDGKYYYRPSYEGSYFELRRTESEADVTEEVTCIGNREIFWARGWLNDSILISPSQTAKIFRDTLVNIETDTQCVLEGEVITFPIEGDTFRMWHEGKITEVTLDSLTFIAPEKSEDE